MRAHRGEMGGLLRGLEGVEGVEERGRGVEGGGGGGFGGVREGRGGRGLGVGGRGVVASQEGYYDTNTAVLYVGVGCFGSVPGVVEDGSRVVVLEQSGTKNSKTQYPRIGLIQENEGYGTCFVRRGKKHSGLPGPRAVTAHTRLPSRVEDDCAREQTTAGKTHARSLLFPTWNCMTIYTYPVPQAFLLPTSSSSIDSREDGEQVRIQSHPLSRTKPLTPCFEPPPPRPLHQ